MRKNKKIALLGGDMRQISVGRRLAENGYCVNAWRVFESGEKEHNDFVFFDSISETLKGCDAVVLPFPTANENGYINCPMHRGEDVLVNDLPSIIRSCIAKNEKGECFSVFGGKLSPSFREKWEIAGIEVYDYFESEELQIKNAVLTAEGAISIAISETDISLWGSRCAVLGFGRIGKILCDRLKSFGASVTVCARKSIDITWAEALGFGIGKISDGDEPSSLALTLADSDIIFNTVPHWIIDEKILSSMKKSSIIIDLASAPGGVDTDAANMYKIRTVRALSLPSRYSAATAGMIIGDFIIATL